MKKSFMILALFVVLTANTFAQRAFDHLTDSINQVLNLSSTIQLANFEYNGSGALWGTYLEAGRTISHSSEYDANIEYLIIAAADNPNCDLGLKVHQGRTTGGPLITRDTNLGPGAVVRFTPRSAGSNTFELINSGRHGAFISLVVLRYRRDARFSFQTLIEALNNTLVVAQQIASLIRPEALMPPNQWTLFGGNVRTSSTTGFYNAQLARGNYILVAAGERSVNNLDVEIVQQHNLNNQDGRVISINSESSFPIDYGTFDANSSRYYNLKVINRSSRNPSAFILGFLIQAY